MWPVIRSLFVVVIEGGALRRGRAPPSDSCLGGCAAPRSATMSLGRHTSTPPARAITQTTQTCGPIRIGLCRSPQLGVRSAGPAQRVGASPTRRLARAAIRDPPTAAAHSAHRGCDAGRGVRRRLATQGARAGSERSTLGRGGRLRVSRGGGGLPIGRCRSGPRLAAVPAALLEIVLERPRCRGHLIAGPSGLVWRISVHACAYRRSSAGRRSSGSSAAASRCRCSRPSSGSRSRRCVTGRARSMLMRVAVRV